MNIFNSLNFFISIFLETFFIWISLYFFQKIFKTQFLKRNTLIYILSNLIFFLLTSLFSNYVNNYLFRIICSALIFIYLENCSKLTTFTYLNLNSIIILNIELGILKLESIIHYNSNFEIVSFLLNGLMPIVLYSIIGIIIYFGSKKVNLDSLFIASINESPIFPITISVINLILVFNSYLFFEIIKVTTIYFLMLDMYFIFSVTNIIHLCKILYSKRKIANLKLCNKTILNMYDNTRTFKHDYTNTIQAIGGYIWAEDLQGLKTYYKQIVNDCNTSNNFEKLNPNLINNPAIYNVLVNKYYIASQNNIKLNIEVLMDLSSVNIKIYYLTKILGILLDNAIEASKECEKKCINISFKQDNNKQLLIIQNTYNNKKISIDKIFEKDYSTKPNNTGLGLWEVKKILNKNNNLNLYTTKNNDYFSQQLEIYFN